MHVDTAQSRCPQCGEMAPQRIVRQQGERPLLWCVLCRHVTIAEGELSLAVDPIAFSPALSVRVDDLDKDHERLLDILNELHAAAKAGRKDDTRSASSRLRRDLDLHFEREEALLARSGYPGLQAHRTLHGALYREVDHLVERLLAAPTAAADEAVLAIKFCLIEHLGEDFKYKDHLAGLAGGDQVSANSSSR